ncbi:hypothetical protein [Demequina sp.]|uniref:hypothetical protein n=1 Tax=Demequina sp. TaxID=2050685 RepID=UPI0025C45994|nr:hypothetical protein [Demequina sp.]
MEWIDFSTDHESIVPAPPGLVWRHLVEPSLMSQSNAGTIVAVTVEGQPGMVGRSFFTERTCERHRPCILKTKVLKSEPLSRWATLTETEEFSLRETRSATPTAAGNWPAWSTVRARSWKDAADSAMEGEYSATNLARMEVGKPPLHDVVEVPMELNHITPRWQGGGHTLDNLEPLWPWEHADIDPYRFDTGERP